MLFEEVNVMMMTLNECCAVKLRNLGLTFGQHQDGRIVIGSTRWFFGIPRFRPKIIGEVLKRPVFTKSGHTGFFQFSAGPKGPIWDLAEVLEKDFGIEVEIWIDPSLPTR